MINLIPEKKAELNKLVDNYVNLLREQDTLKEDMKELKNICAQTVDEDIAKRLPMIAQARWKAEKLQEVIDKAQSALDGDKELRGF